MAQESSSASPSIPKTMKAIVATALGDPIKVMKLVNDRPITQPKSGQALIKVLYASLNPIDWKMMKGNFGILGKKAGHVPGFDVCGRIVKFEDKKNLKKLQIGDLIYGQSILAGDMIYGQAGGSFAEYCVANIYDIQKAPKNVSPSKCAAIPLVTQTSWKALVTAKLTKGQKLLILGGSTATGMAAIQIAKKHFGCSEVVVTSSQEELMKSLGADRVINYRKEKWEVVLRDYECDAIYDCVGGVDSWNACQSEKVLKENGHYVTIVGDKEDKLTVGGAVSNGLSTVNRTFWGAVGYQKYQFVLCDPSSYLDDITKMIENGTLDIMLDKESPYKFEDYAKMFEKSIARKAKGKLVIKVSDDVDVNNANDEQKNDIEEEVVDDKDKNEKYELYKINKRPKDDMSDNEAEEVVSNAKKEKQDNTIVVEQDK